MRPARQFRASNEENLLADPVSGTEVNELIQSQENKNTKKARPWQQDFPKLEKRKTRTRSRLTQRVPLVEEELLLPFRST
jgi:hypothetical protein